MTMQNVALQDGWELLPLTDVAEVVMGQSPPGSTYNNEGQGLPFFQGKTDFGDDYPTPRKWCTAPRRVAEPGDILMSVRAPVGPTNVAKQQCAIGRGLAAIRARPGVPGDLIRHAIKLQENEIASWGTGSTFTAINKQHFKDIRIPLPPPDVRALLTATLDANVKLRRSSTSHLAAAREAIERFRKAVLSAACSGRLTADWRAENPELTGQMTMADRQIEIEPLVETPDGWAWIQLADLADLKGGIQKGAKLKVGQRTREVPYLRVANVQRGWLDLSEIKTIAVPESKIADLRLEPGDVLFNEGGDRDKLGRGWVWEGQIDECVHQNHVFRARLRNRDMQPRFFSWFGNTIGTRYFIDRGKQTVNLASLNMSTLKALPVPLPTPEEQAEIVRRVDQLLTLADGLRDRIDTAEHKIKRSSQSILAKAFRGELVTSGVPE